MPSSPIIRERDTLVGDRAVYVSWDLGPDDGTTFGVGPRAVNVSAENSAKTARFSVTPVGDEAYLTGLSPSTQYTVTVTLTYKPPSDLYGGQQGATSRSTSVAVTTAPSSPGAPPTVTPTTVVASSTFPIGGEGPPISFGWPPADPQHEPLPPEPPNTWKPWYPLGSSSPRFRANQRVCVFYPRFGYGIAAVADDGVVHEMRWDPITGWGSWRPIHEDARSDPDATVTAIGSDTLAVVGGDGQIWSTTATGRRQNTWEPWSPVSSSGAHGVLSLSGPSFAQRQRVASLHRLARSSGDTGCDVFAVGKDGVVRQCFRDERHPKWSGWSCIRPETTFGAEAEVVALPRELESANVELFAQGEDGGVWTISTTDRGKSWTPWHPIRPGTPFVRPQTPVALWRGAHRIELFMVAVDGTVQTSWWQDGAEDWAPWQQPLSAVPSDARAVVTGLTAREMDIDLALVGRDERVWFCEFRPGEATWRDWRQIHGEAAFPAGQTVLLRVGWPNRRDAFAVGKDGRIWQSWVPAD